MEDWAKDIIKDCVITAARIYYEEYFEEFKKKPDEDLLIKKVQEVLRSNIWEEMKYSINALQYFAKVNDEKGFEGTYKFIIYRIANRACEALAREELARAEEIQKKEGGGNND